MKNKLVLLYWLVILIAPEIVYSQKTFISVGGELALPSSTGLKMIAGIGFGGSIRLESSWKKHISGMATIGYLSFAKNNPYSSAPATTSEFKAIPIQVGIKYYPKEKTEIAKGFYISAELGVMRTTTHFTYAANPDFNFKESGLSVAPGLGYLFRNLESSFRLQYNLSASGFNVYYYNFRLAYAFLKRKNKS